MNLSDLLLILGSSDRRDGRNLTNAEAYRAFSVILDGAESEIRIGAFLMAMRWKGVTVEELNGFAQAARERATIPCQGMPGLVCVCPSHDGYDTVPPLEVAAGLIAAGAGSRVLLISERRVPPKRGLTAASALEELGCGFTWDPQEAQARVEATRFAGVAASGMLPALLSLRRVRGEVGVRTPLSTVEKLIAPSTAAVVLGAQHGPVLGVAVETMVGLGHSNGIAIQGLGGGTIPTLKKRTRGIELHGTHQVPLTVEPQDFGLTDGVDPELPLFSPPVDGEGTDDNPLLIKAAADTIQSVLHGEISPARSASILGAAVILKAGGRAPTLAEGVDQAIESLESGAAMAVWKKQT